MNPVKITVESVSETANNVTIIGKDKKKYKFFKTEWDRENNKPGTVESKPFKQFQGLKLFKGTEISIDMFESKEKSFVNEEGKTIIYKDRLINEFLVGGAPASPLIQESSPF